MAAWLDKGNPRSHIYGIVTHAHNQGENILREKRRGSPGGDEEPPQRRRSTFYVLERRVPILGIVPAKRCNQLLRALRFSQLSSQAAQVVVIEVLQPLLGSEYMHLGSLNCASLAQRCVLLSNSGGRTGVRGWLDLHTLGDPSLLSHAGLPGTQRNLLQCDGSRCAQ